MVSQLVAKQREFFESGATRSYESRIANLVTLKEAIKKHEPEILAALKQDMNKPEMEGYLTEVGVTLEELSYVMKKLKKWMRMEKVKTPITSLPGKSFVVAEPYGVTLIMAPWNYPFMLSIEPLIGAMMAGNCAVLKPSAYAPATSNIISKMLGEAFDPRYIAVVEGGRKENSALLEQRFDYIFFTGSMTVGKIVMEAASKHLTPVSLELGGKSPCIVDETASLGLAAKRLAFGKYLNSGQTCVAPDYLLVHRSVQDEFIVKLKSAIAGFFPNGDYSAMSSIINGHHYNRLMNLLENETMVLGGKGDADSRIIEPTLLVNADWDSPVMQDEIFGPILPIIPYDNMDDVIKKLTSLPKPLALYLFTNNKQTEREVLNRVSFGGGCVNDTIMHVASSFMGFGGVGTSGMGSYHGKQSFDTFSHHKSVLKKSNMFDPSMRYRPYTKKNFSIVKMLMK